MSDCSENPFKWALVLAHLKDCSGKRDGMAGVQGWANAGTPKEIVFQTHLLMSEIKHNIAEIKIEITSFNSIAC
ncbi:MAG: hypothetical protein ACK5IJ_03730 [Mangrovibacterium sp.]